MAIENGRMLITAEFKWGHRWTGSYYQLTPGEGVTCSVMEYGASSFRGCPLGRTTGELHHSPEEAFVCALADFRLRGRPELYPEFKDCFDFGRPDWYRVAYWTDFRVPPGVFPLNYRPGYCLGCREWPRAESEKDHNCGGVLTGTLVVSGVRFGYKSYLVAGDVLQPPRRNLFAFLDGEPVASRTGTECPLAEDLERMTALLRPVAARVAARNLWAQVQALRAENARLLAAR